jgi:hypothetical protein
MIEVLPTMGKYKYDTWRILPVKCYIDNSVCLRSCIWNVNGHQSHGGVLSVRLARPPWRRIGSSLLFTPLPIVGVTRGAYNGLNAHHRGWRTGEGDQRGGWMGANQSSLREHDLYPEVDPCHTPFWERGNEGSICVPRMFKSHAWQQYDKQMQCYN